MNRQSAIGNWQWARSAAVLLIALAPPLRAGENAELKSAREAITKGKYADGLKVLDKLLGEEKTPDVVSAARALRVRALGDTGRYKEAVAEAARVEQLAPKSADALALHAEALMAVGRYKDAGERLARAVKLDAEHVKSRTVALQLAKTMGDKNALGRETTFFFRLYSQGKAKTAEALTAVAMAAEDDDPHGAWREYNNAHKANPKYLDAYLHAGFHCLSKYAWKYAAEEFKKALKLNPHAAAAHAGLAIVALRNSKFKPAEAAIATALKINPSLPVARALRAALLTMEERHAEARQQLEAVLAVNPHHLDALSLLAAHHEALGKTAERDKVARRVLALNPRHADLYTTLARAGERRRQFPLAVQWARKAIALDGEYWEGYYLAGMNLLRIGEEREGYRLLDRAFKLNSFNIWAYNMLNVLDRDFKQKRFDRLETAHFVVKLPTGQSRVLWPYVKSILEEAWEKFTRKYGVEPVGPKEYGGKVLVLFFPDHEQFAVRTVGLPGLGALGACFGQVITMPSPRLSRMRRSPFNWRRVLEHEFVHVITLQKSRYHIPRWFTEGISTHEEGEPQIRWDRLLVRVVAKNEFLPLEKLNTGFSRPDKPYRVPVSYYQSALVVEYLEKTHGADGLRKACELFAQGRQTPEVLSAVTGKSIAELNQITTDYIRDYAKQIKGSPPVGKKELGELEKAVKKNDADAQAWVKIAAGKMARRKFGDARKAAKKAIEIDAKLARAHAILGIIALKVDKKKDEAKKHFTAAKGADADYFAPRLYLGVMAKEAGRTDEAIAELEAARRIYPRFADLRRNPHLLLAALYIQRKQPQKAIAVLREHTSIHNNSLKAFILLGDLLAKQGKHAEAAAAFLGAIYIDPFATGSHLSAARAFEAIGAFGRAATEYTVVVHLDKRHLQALVGRARCLAEAGKADEARKAIAAVREIDPANAEIIKIEKKLKK